MKDQRLEAFSAPGKIAEYDRAEISRLDSIHKIHAARNNKLHCILDVMDPRFDPIRRLLATRDAAIDGYFKYPENYTSEVRDTYLEMFTHCNKHLGDFLGI